MSQSHDPARVAVITRTKNRPVLLERARESVTGQVFTDLEWIIVNDGGEPGAVEESASAARDQGFEVKVIHNPQSLGMEAASNRGVAAASSEFLVIHDDDDSWEPGFLDATVAFLTEKPHYGGVIAHVNRVIERFDGTTYKILRREPYNHELKSIYIIDLAGINRFPPICFLFRRSVYDDLGGFNESVPVLGDWDFHLRFAMRSDIGVIQRPLARYHHRIDVAEKDSAYSNTVIDGTDLHVEYDARLRNQWLREDMAAGKIGLGTLVSLARLQQKLEHSLGPMVVISSIMLKIKRLIWPRHWFSGR